MANMDKIKAALNTVEKGLATINSNEDWLRYLAFQSKFYNYSYNNTVLIMMQRPDASWMQIKIVGKYIYKSPYK